VAKLARLNRRLVTWHLPAGPAVVVAVAVGAQPVVEVVQPPVRAQQVAPPQAAEPVSAPAAAAVVVAAAVAGPEWPAPMSQAHARARPPAAASRF
jgi:hypothetical protein